MSLLHELPPKKEVALALLETSSVFVHLDPRRSGVVVPMNFRKQPQLVLQIGLNMPVPIPDLEVDDEGLRCTLSFNRSPFYCTIPWSGIFAMVGEDSRGMVWPDDVPAELSVQVRSPQPERAAPAAKPRRAPARASEQPADAAPAKKPRKKREPKKPRLVVVPPPAPSSPDTAGAATPRARPRPAPVQSIGAARAKAKPKPKREIPPYLRVIK